MVEEFVCGGGAAAINVIVTFPPNKLMFRQQLYGMTIVEAYESIVTDGIHRLYRGVKPPLVSSVISKSMMFGLYHWFDTLWHHQHGHLAAFCTGTSEALLGPFERSQTLLQIPKFNQEIKGAMDAARHVMQYGWMEHYRGLSAVLLRNGPTNVCFFGLREPLRSSLVQIEWIQEQQQQHVLVDFACGAVLGACLSTLFFPINVARSRMQSVLGGPFMPVTRALHLVYHERNGIRGMYRGVYMNFTRSLLSWGIINASYEMLRRQVFAADGHSDKS